MGQNARGRVSGGEVRVGVEGVVIGDAADEGESEWRTSAGVSACAMCARAPTSKGGIAGEWRRDL